MGKQALRMLCVVVLVLVVTGLSVALPQLTHEAAAAGCAVTSTGDSGSGTLREKMTDQTCDSLIFNLDGTGPWTIALASDLPILSRPLAIAGPGADQLTIDRQDRNTFAKRIFPLGAGGNLTLSGLTLTRAYYAISLGSDSHIATTGVMAFDNGNFVYLDGVGTATLSDTKSENSGANSGVGLVVLGGGHATVTNSSFINSALLVAGASATITQSTFTASQVFIADGDLNIANSTLSDNSAGVELRTGGNATIANSTFINNGSGVWFSRGGAATVTNSTFVGGLRGLFLDHGGSASVTGSSVTGASSGVYIDGGGTAMVTNSTITGDSSGNFVGVYVDRVGAAQVINSTIQGFNYDIIFIRGGSITVTGSTITDALYGAYLFYGGDLTIDSSTLTRNSWGVVVDQSASNDQPPHATVINSTFTGNGTGVNLRGDAVATVSNSTLSGNTYGLDLFSGGTATVANTIIAASPITNCRIGSTAAIIDRGLNLDDSAACGFSVANQSLSNIASGLDPAGLQDNGGPAKTIALLPGSPAIDAGGNSANGCPSSDQRGISRPQGSACDIGAFELGQPNRPPVANAGLDQVVSEGTPVTLDGAASTDPDNDVFTYSWVTVDATGPAITLSSTIVANPTFQTSDNGNYTFRLTVSDGKGGNATDEVTVIVSNVPPTPSISGAPSTGTVGTALNLLGSATDPSSADTAAGFALAWSVTKDGTPYGAGGTGPIFSITPVAVGNYVVTLSATDKDDGVGTATAMIAVSQAQLIVAVNDSTRVYGDPNPVVTATAVGLLNGDTLASLGIACASAATATSPVGIYDITCSGNPPDYAVTFINGTLTVTKAPTALAITSGANLALDAQGRVEVKARLTWHGGADPLAGRVVTFGAGGASASGTTDANGVATVKLPLASEQYTLAASFAGDANLQPSQAAVRTVIAYQATRFVVWGGNAGGLSIGQSCQFWGAQWAKQVTAGDYQANNSFKGYADILSADGKTWTASPGGSGNSPATVPRYIAVIVAKHATKNGGTISGTVDGYAILRVDSPQTYQPNPGHNATGTLVATLP